MEAISISLKQKLKEQFVMFPPEIMPCACCCIGVLEITTIFKRDSDNQIFLNGDVLLNGS